MHCVQEDRYIYHILAGSHDELQNRIWSARGKAKP